MCPHEEKVLPAPALRIETAWNLLEKDDGPNQHLYRVDALLCTLRLALDALNEEVTNPDIYNLYTVCKMAEEELSSAFEGMEILLREVNVHH